MNDTEPLKATQISSEDASDLMWRDDHSAVGPWTKRAEQHIEEHRWYDRFWLVLAHEDGTFWGLEYETGKTEIQETVWPWERGSGLLDLVQLHPHTVITVEWRPEKSIPK